MSNVITQAFAMGVVSGMRSMTAPALVTHYLSRDRRPRLGRLNFMRSKLAATAFKVAAAGELVGDKLSNTPARTQAGLGLRWRHPTYREGLAAIQRAEQAGEAFGQQ